MPEPCYCELLHNALEMLPLIKYPFDIKQLPDDGIYFFYENGEFWGHGGNKPRIVHAGTNSCNGNFKKRIQEHYISDLKLTNFDNSQSKPSDSSILRKYIGNALLAANKSDYINVWNMKFNNKEKREQNGYLRNIEKERKIEEKINQILRNLFSFRFIEINEKEYRDGEHGLKQNIIRTIDSCNFCCNSSGWPGIYSNIKEKNKNNKLWQVDLYHNANPLDSKSWKTLIGAIDKTYLKYSKSKIC